MKADEFVHRLVDTLERYLDGKTSGAALVRAVDVWVADEYPDDMDDVRAQVIRDLHVELALYVVDPAEQSASELYHGPEELKRFVAEAHECLTRISSGIKTET